MAVSGKKYKIFKICKELNLGHETIFSYLEQNKIKFKGAGPNAFVEEDIYLDLLERFATDKQKADTLKAKRLKDQDGIVEDEEVKVQKIPDESAYMQVLKQSIVDGVEALSKSKDEDVKLKKPKLVARKKHEPIVKLAEKEKEEQPTVKEEETPKEEKIDKKIEPVADKPKKEVEKEKPAEVISKPSSVESLIEKKVEEKAGKGKKEKSKPEKVIEFEDDKGLSDKEKKRRKAMEMIRKDKDTKRGGRIDLTRIGEGDGGKRRGKIKKPKKKEVDLKEVQNTVKKTLASIESRGKKPKKHRKIKTEDG